MLINIKRFACKANRPQTRKKVEVYCLKANNGKPCKLLRLTFKEVRWKSSG